MRFLMSHMAAAALAALATSAAAQMADDEGMVLYTFDNDTAGVSTCYDNCAVNWPPYLATEGEEKGESWTQVERTDGTMQWAYEGKPVYYYVQDTAPGDATGDGVNGVWHIIEE